MRDFISYSQEMTKMVQSITKKNNLKNKLYFNSHRKQNKIKSYPSGGFHQFHGKKNGTNATNEDE